MGGKGLVREAKALGAFGRWLVGLGGGAGAGAEAVAVLGRVAEPAPGGGPREVDRAMASLRALLEIANWETASARMRNSGAMGAGRPLGLEAPGSLEGGGRRGEGPGGSASVPRHTISKLAGQCSWTARDWLIT